MAGTKVPTDPSLTPEMRRFLDDLARNQEFRNLVADSLQVGSITAAGPVTIGGLNPFLQGGEADEGLDHNWVDHGTVTSGTLTIDPMDGFFHKVTANGTFAISPAANRGGSCILHVTNGATAGTVTFSGWSKKYPSASLTTTSGNKFAIPMYFFDAEGADYMIQARQ